MPQNRPGVPEVAVAAAMEYEARCAGAEACRFQPFLRPASAPRLCMAASRRAFRGAVRGLRFWCYTRHYCSDRTRTVHVGRPSDGARQFYHAVLEAQLAAIAAVQPESLAPGGWRCAWRVAQEKLARYFTHSTGHGLGLEIHEAPRLAAGKPRSWSRNGDYD